jgi:hypothetical protein
MFGSSLVNGSLGKGKDRPFDEHFDYLLELANHGVFHANQVLFIIVTLSSPFQKKPGINLKTQTLKSGFANGSPSHNTPGSSVFQKVKGQLVEVQANWEDLREVLPLIEAVGHYNRLLSLQSNLSSMMT